MTAGAWTWAAARCRGVSHERAGLPVQDAFVCVAPAVPGRPIVAVVSDGAGSASHGGRGASLVCRTLCSHARQHFATGGSLPDADHLHSWLQAARERIAAIAGRRQLLPRNFAATLVAVVSDGTDTLALHVGDGCAVIRDAASRRWSALSWPDHGEYASTTYFVTDEPAPRARIARYAGEISGLALFSDGLEQLVLDLRAQTPHTPFFDSMIAPVARSRAKAKDRELSRQLLKFLDGDAVNSRTEDDKTLILAVRR
jgi:hypothetical protein